ncbi:MAG TPA: hydroxyacylglutathione hydrolase [Devosia sp.]|nr:hydroxyacylglutathione hydrolase [Devosia sp.]
MPVIVDVFLCRTDNYGYLVHDVATRKTAAIDAPDAGAIKAALARRGWTLNELFITHHHRDHVEGVPVLKSDFDITVTGPRAEADKIIGLDAIVGAGDTLSVGETSFTVIPTPGHTLGQIALHNAADGHLFSADALFSLGCGRMIEGKPGPMWEGLKALRALPDHTLMFCGHEYTVANARFALSVDPRNAALTIRAAEVERMRAEGKFTVPVSLGMEKATNPFLRADKPELARAMGLDPGVDPAVVFGALRAAKDKFGS